jgi:hypothetical protein
MVPGQLSMHMEKNEIWFLPHTINKNQLCNCTSKCEWLSNTSKR